MFLTELYGLGTELHDFKPYPTDVQTLLLKNKIKLLSTSKFASLLRFSQIVTLA